MKMLKRSLICLSLTAGAAFAQVPAAPAAGPNGAPPPAGAVPHEHGEMPREHFKEMKEELIRHHEARIQALQKGVTCLRAAPTPEAVHACMEEQREARGRLREAVREHAREHPMAHEHPPEPPKH